MFRLKDLERYFHFLAEEINNNNTNTNNILLTFIIKKLDTESSNNNNNNNNNNSGKLILELDIDDNVAQFNQYYNNANKPDHAHDKDKTVCCITIDTFTTLVRIIQQDLKPATALLQRKISHTGNLKIFMQFKNEMKTAMEKTKLEIEHEDNKNDNDKNSNNSNTVNGKQYISEDLISINGNIGKSFILEFDERWESEVELRRRNW
eukprot:Pgem_evm1s18168